MPSLVGSEMCIRDSCVLARRETVRDALWTSEPKHDFSGAVAWTASTNWHRCGAGHRLAQAETYHHRRHRCSGTSLGPSRCRADAIGDVARAETVFLADASPRVQEAPGDALDLQRATHRSRGRRRGLPGRGAAGIRAGPRANDLSCCGPRARRGAARRRSSVIGCGEVLCAPGRWSRPPRAAELPRGALESDTTGSKLLEKHSYESPAVPKRPTARFHCFVYHGLVYVHSLAKQRRPHGTL